jgi:predicted mannosyl-3-phosphoglycerate phosphatase (HAD superfamily)
VGTTVVQGEEFAPVGAIEEQLDRLWPGREAVLARLEGLPGIEEQEVRPPRRVSYWLREGEMDAAIARMAERLEGLAVELVGSAGVYIDVLPGGVNKGSTLRRVLEWLERSETEVVVAGDTLNDLALFETGMPGIVVGNCEVELRTRVGHREHLYLAEGEGAAGILEGLRHFGWLEEGGAHGE